MSCLSKSLATHCASITEQLNQATIRAQTNQRIIVAITFLQTNLHLDLTPEAIAKRVGLSTSRLNCLFKEKTGVTLGKYIKLLKLETARHLLENGFPTLQEVMNNAGINDPSHFSRDFRNTYGVTPAKYRDQYQRVSGNSGLVGKCLTSDPWRP